MTPFFPLGLNFAYRDSNFAVLLNNVTTVNGEDMLYFDLLGFQSLTLVQTTNNGRISRCSKESEGFKTELSKFMRTK
jgi:hypothetical protein